MLSQENIEIIDQTRFRDLDASDYEDVARLIYFGSAGESTALTYDQARGLVREALLGHLFGIVAEHNGGLCGVAIYTLEKCQNDHIGKLISITVDQSYFGCGIRSGLENAIERQLEAVGIALKEPFGTIGNSNY